MLRIALIDGDDMIRAGRKLMISAQQDLQLVFEEADAAAALEKIPDLLVDVIIIDHRLKGFDGIVLAQKLVDAFAEKKEVCPAIVVTGTYATGELVMAAIRCGATDVVTGDAPMSELLSAVKSAALKSKPKDFSSFDEVLNHANYRPQPDPIFILRRSQLNDVQQKFLSLLDSGLDLSQAKAKLKLAEFEYEELLESILIDLHLGTVEQLYLALHDARATINQ